MGASLTPGRATPSREKRPEEAGNDGGDPEQRESGADERDLEECDCAERAKSHALLIATFEAAETESVDHCTEIAEHARLGKNPNGF
jgi:hypothetical protein